MSLPAHSGGWNRAPPGRRYLIYWLTLLWLAPLSIPQISSVTERLRLSGTLRSLLINSITLRTVLTGLRKSTPGQIAEALDPFPQVVLFAVHQICDDETLRQLLVSYVTRWQSLQPVATGDTLRELGIPPGPHYRTILRALRSAWLDGHITDPEQELALIGSIVERE